MNRANARHPAQGCTKVQRLAFDRIVLGNDSCIEPRTARALMQKGLITRRIETLPGKPPVKVYRYDVPVRHYWDYCQWAIEQPEGQASNER